MKKILIINGSPNKKGNTAAALKIVEQALTRPEVEITWLQLDKKPVHGCIECGYCKKEKRCIFTSDQCNEIIDKIKESDALLIGSPVYFSGANGALCALLDRVFYATCAWHQMFAGKIGAAVVTQGLSGGSTALDRLHKYFLASQMVIASSCDYLILPEIVKSDISEENKGMLVTLGNNILKLLGI